MAVNSSLRSGDRIPAASPAKIPCALGTCDLGVVGTSYSFDPGDDVIGTLGAGKLTQCVLYLLAMSGSRVVAMPTTGTYPALPAATQDGVGPTVTVALAAGNTRGAFDDFALKLRCIRAGAGGVGQLEVMYDGTTVAETIAIPAEGPAVLRGTVNLATVTYPYVGLNAKHLDFTAPSADVITFGASAASAQAIADQFNTGADAAGLAVRARIAETSTGSFFELYSTGAGTGVTMTLDLAASDADSVLGLATNTATGTAATLTLPFTGVTLTFTTTAAVFNTTWTIPLAGPRSSVSALSAGATSARDNYDTHPFGFLLGVEEFATMGNAASALSTLNTLRAGWNADPDDPIFVTALVPTAFHTASATRATNDANIGTNDAAFLAAFPAATPDTVFCSVAHDDAYIPGAAGLPAGTYRRPASWCGAAKVAAAPKIAANPAEGGVGGASLLAADALTRARNEATATTKLGRLAGAGAWALKSTSAGLGAPAFEVCATRAGATSRLRDPGALAIGMEIQRIAFLVVEGWNGETWETNPANPTAADPSETAPRADDLEQILRAALIPENAPANVSAFDVQVTAPNLSNDGKANVAIPFNPLGVVETVTVAVTATGAAIVPA